MTVTDKELCWLGIEYEVKRGLGKSEILDYPIRGFGPTQLRNLFIGNQGSNFSKGLKKERGPGRDWKAQNWELRLEGIILGVKRQERNGFIGRHYSLKVEGLFQELLGQKEGGFGKGFGFLQRKGLIGPSN